MGFPHTSSYYCHFVPMRVEKAYEECVWTLSFASITKVVNANYDDCVANLKLTH
jgi:hypothetical protein